MKTKSKLYFRDVDSTNCETLGDILSDAKLDELTEITVLEAIPDDGLSGYVWCTLYNCVEKSSCSKAMCESYKSKSGRGKCENKGSLYLHGESETFKI